MTHLIDYHYLNLVSVGYGIHLIVEPSLSEVKSNSQGSLNLSESRKEILGI